MVRVRCTATVFAGMSLFACCVISCLVVQVAIAQDRTRHLRKITACFKKLYELSDVRRPQLCFLSDPMIQHCIAHQHCVSLQGCDERLELVYLAFDRMCNVKEFR